MPWSVLDSPIGPLTLVAGVRGLRAIHFAGEGVVLDPGERDDRALAGAREQLRAYFAGRRQRFELELDPGGTPFQQAVWATVRAVPYGETTTYREVATALGGDARLSRAVGACNARTPIPIILPCHRVLGSTGALTGYRGGLDAKRALLELERRYAASAAGSVAPAASDRSASTSTIPPAPRVRTTG